MVNQEHSGSGDNVAGNKYENIIRSVQARDLMGVTESIMRDVCYRDLDKAQEKLNVLFGISALEADVQLLLKALRVKAEITNTLNSPSKNELLMLLGQECLSDGIREVVTSILIDLESRTSEIVARDRYSNLIVSGVYTKEVFYERLASTSELKDNFPATKIYDLSEQELTGLVRGAIRVEDFVWAFELAQCLNCHFPSSNSATLLLYTEVCLLTTQNQQKHFVSLSKNEKKHIDRLIEQLLDGIADSSDSRHVATLINLLSLTRFSDTRLYEQGKVHLEKIRKMSPVCAEYIEQFFNDKSSFGTKFELVSDSLDLEQFAQLDFALQNNQIKPNTVSKWVDRGGAVLAGDDYIDSFFDLYLRASVCSSDNMKAVQLLDEKALHFFELDNDEFRRINPHAMLRLCEKFIDVGLPLNAVKYLEPFLSDEPWVSPIFQCYLDALFNSEKFDLFLSKIKHLEPSEKTVSIYLREAQVYERLCEYDLSIQSTRAALKLSPHTPYSWHLLLHVSKEKGLNKKELSDIVFEIPEVIFLSYDESKVPLINEIATYVDINLADRVLVDWFAQNPDKVATALTQIHLNSLRNRPEVTNNPYQPLHCCDGVTYTDGFESFTRLLVRDVDCTHPLLLDIDSPLGQTLNELQEGATSGDYTMLERLPSYVAAYRHAADIRHKGNDGTDVFRMYSVPSNEDEMIPYIENIFKRHSSEEKRRDEALQNPNIPLVIRGHYTDKGNPVRGAIMHLSSRETTQYMRLYSGGEEQFDKVIVDVYTAVYLALMGFAPSVINLDLKLVFCHHTKKVLESWIEEILRDDYMSMGVSENGMYRITSEDIQRDWLDLIQGLKILLEHAEVEALKPADTPDILVKIRDMVDDTIYSTFQLSVANDIPLLCIDHLMIDLAHHSGCPAANMNTFVEKVLNSLSLKDRKKSIQYNLFSGTPVSILYQDIMELSCSPEPSDTYLVFKFMDKYGEAIGGTDAPLQFLTGIIRNVTATAYIEGKIFGGGRVVNPQYDGYVEHVFNSCCRVAMSTLTGETAEHKFAMLIFSVINTPSRVRRYAQLITYLASEFAKGHFLDFDACNKALASCQMKSEENKKTEEI
ncbi:TPA: tetratricopeptide repeat protein [Vibrio parahaemolyticus]